MTFWDLLDKLVHKVQLTGKVLVGEDLNGYVGKDRNKYERIYTGHDLGVEMILEKLFCLLHQKMILDWSTLFIKSKKNI